MIRLYETWKDAVEELIEAEHFWLAAIVALGGVCIATLAVIALLLSVLKVLGLWGYTLLIIGIALYFTQRSMRNHFEKEYADKEDDENETGVS